MINFKYKILPAKSIKCILSLLQNFYRIKSLWKLARKETQYEYRFYNNRYTR